MKWAIAGAVLGAAAAAWTDTHLGSGALFGAAGAMAFRKWVFGNFWM